MNDNMNDIIFCKACEIYNIIESEINTFKYMEINDQIEGIIYYVTSYMSNLSYMSNMSNNINEKIDDKFIEQIFKNCHNAYNNVNYPYMQGESEWSYIEELREAETFSMIESVIKDLYEYYQK
jgi:hypothetical protein